MVLACAAQFSKHEKPILKNTFCFVAQCPRSVPPRVNRAAYQPVRCALWRSSIPSASYGAVNCAAYPPHTAFFFLTLLKKLCYQAQRFVIFVLFV